MDVIEFAELYLKKHGVRLYHYHRELLRAMIEGKEVVIPEEHKEYLVDIYDEYLMISKEKENNNAE